MSNGTIQLTPVRRWARVLSNVVLVALAIIAIWLVIASL